MFWQRNTGNCEVILDFKTVAELLEAKSKQVERGTRFEIQNHSALQTAPYSSTSILSK